MAGFRFDGELTSFVLGPQSVLVATRSAALLPHATRACGVRVEAPDRLDLLLPRATSAQALANLRDNREIAVCVGSPTTYRTVQLKGRFLDVHDASEEDRILAEGQLRAFADQCAPQGIPRERIRNAWLFDTWRVEVRVVSAYVQTPGPGAGERMEDARGD